eukprot:359399-Chlamydomonas_euryale.AAC.1
MCACAGGRGRCAVKTHACACVRSACAYGAVCGRAGVCLCGRGLGARLDMQTRASAHTRERPSSSPLAPLPSSLSYSRLRAPEVTMRRGATKAADYWALGVLPSHPRPQISRPTPSIPYPPRRPKSSCGAARPRPPTTGRSVCSSLRC